ncbi:quercetin dioxygenase-like cupin family protein [Bradyrhizobium sp. LB7.2]
MMSISAFTNRIAALLRRSAITPRPGIELPRTMFLAIVAAAIAGASPAIAQDREQVKLVFEHALPNVEGKRMAALLVSYPPGSKSLPHRHAESAFIYAYVLSGAIRSQVGNAPAQVYHIGEGFYETQGSHHRISENASDTEPASLLAVFVVDSKDGALTIPDKDAAPK